MNKGFIHIKDISKKYKDTDFYSVKKLDLSINKKEVFGLLGPNGAGKTTLISILSGLIKPTTGTISINDLNYKTNKTEIRKLIGVVPQEYALYPTLTAYENLHYFGAMYNLKGNLLKEKINSSLHNLGLTAFAHKKIQTFSGGMKRRVNLTAGTLHNPQVLFLDEPTVGVDVQSKNVIVQHLKELNKQGTTIIYSSHHMKEAEEFCSRVAIIDQGKIIAIGTPAALIDSVKNATRLEDVYLHLTGEELRDYV